MEEKKFKLIVHGCMNQNPKSQKELYNYFYNKMLSICLQHTPNSDIAKDVLQDGFIKIFNSIHTFKYNIDDSGLEIVLYSWMRRIVFNTSIDRIRREKPQLTQSISDFNQDGHFINETQDIELRELKELRIKLALDAVNDLSPMLKSITNKIIFEGYTHQQVADEFKIGLGTSKSYFFRAKGKLKKIVEKKLRMTDYLK